MTDRELLNAILDHVDTTEEEREAFENMSRRLAFAILTPKQRGWAEDTARRLDVLEEPGATNDVSSGKVRPASGPMDFSGFGPKALRPPGRRA